MKPLVMLRGTYEPPSFKRRRTSGHSAVVLRLANKVLASVATLYGLTTDVVLNSHIPEAVRARRHWIVLVQDSWALSAAEAGRVCGVDHTTVLAAQRMRARDREREIAA